MSRHFTMPRPLRKAKSTATDRQPQYAGDKRDRKAQHILGMTEEDMKAARNGSLSSTGTTQVQSSALSEAITAPVVNVELVGEEKKTIPMLPELNLRLSSIRLRDSYALSTPTSTKSPSTPNKLKKASSSSLHSWYNKQEAPLSVSQQTSDSSTRDFALRKGAPSVVNSKGQELEHGRQLRLVATKTDDEKQTFRQSPQVTTTPLGNNSKPLSVPPLVKRDQQTQELSAKISHLSLGNASATSAGSKDGQISSDTKRKSLKMRKQPATQSVQPTNQHDRFKINIHRPKVGTKHWFDDLEDDSSEADTFDKPEFKEELVKGVEEALQSGKFGLTNNMQGVLELEDTQPVISRRETQSELSRLLEVRELNTFNSRGINDKRNNGKASRLQQLDLSQHSILNLSSSDDESDADFDGYYSTMSESETNRTTFPRENLSSYDGDESDIDMGVATIISTTAISHPDRARLSSRSIRRQSPPPVPHRSSSRNGKHATDSIMGILQSKDDLITSFPPTPNDPSSSRKATQRNSVIYEESESALPELHDECVPVQALERSNLTDSLDDPSTVNPTTRLAELYMAESSDPHRAEKLSNFATRAMQVTEQEESLIAAMRLKRAAMKRKTANVNRQDALKILEYGGLDLQSNHLRRSSSSSDKRLSYARQKYRESGRWSQHRRSLSGDLSRRPDSTTTFQTSIADRSTNQSRATFVSDASEELQLPYSTFSGPMVAMIPNSLRRNDSRQFSDRSTFYSTVSDESTGNRDSHVVMLDPLDKQLLREEIPSQLFMEAPFLGWEARANLQPAR